MTPEDRKSKLDDIAKRLFDLREELCRLAPDFELAVDKKAVGHIITDLAWAVENCTVIGLHQVGKALEDNMGFGPFEVGQK